MLIIKLVGIIVGFSIITAALYLWILPKTFHGYKSNLLVGYAPLIIGVSGAGLIGGKFFYNQSLGRKYLLSIFGGIIVSALVLYCSLFIMLNIGGS